MSAPAEAMNGACAAPATPAIFWSMPTSSADFPSKS